MSDLCLLCQEFFFFHLNWDFCIDVMDLWFSDVQIRPSASSYKLCTVNRRLCIFLSASYAKISAVRGATPMTLLNLFGVLFKDTDLFCATEVQSFIGH